MLERIADNALLAAAFAAAGILVFLGVRKVRRRSRSRVANRFLMYLSAALVIVGGSLAPSGGRGPGAASAWGQDVGKRPAPASWPEIRATWDAVWSASGASSQQRVDKAKAALRELHEAKTISRAMMEFVVAGLEKKSDLAERIRLLGLARAAAADARTMGIAWLTDPLIQAARETFVALRPFSTPARLKASGMARDDYRKLVMDLVDSVHALFLSGGGGRVKPVDFPDVVALYGIRPSVDPGPRKAPVPPVLIREIRGEVRYRSPGMAWIALAPKVQLTTCSVLENPGNRKALLILTNGMEIALDAEEIRTGWELEPRIPTDAALEREIAALIADLGSNQIEVREEATQKLRKIGLPAVSALEKAYRSEDPEVRSRAKFLLEAIRSERGEPVVDNLKPVAEPAPQGPEEPGPMTKYGIRPDK